ncbi:hypothetical protein CDL15_Pgr005256 [Punica granatum]|uniref:Uncharacterized protein n=1 Tax=Punica granatum TaxID=22663 RepID=A0A218WIL9_PUNGR|nr:hypothetical protein CDL15_Pgr005256 [Punica granatum]
MQKSKLARVSRPGKSVEKLVLVDAANDAVTEYFVARCLIAVQLNDQIGVDAGTKSFHRSLAFGAVVCLLCERIVGSRRFAFRNSSSSEERLRLPSGRESESAVVLAVCNTCDPDITSKSCEKY